jgi:hypothetical protein
MAAQPDPLPPPSIPIVDISSPANPVAIQGVPSLTFRQWLLKLAAAVKGLVGMVSGSFTSPVPLIAVTVPTNHNAMLAGVAVGQLYCGVNDPTNVYIRTV